MVPLCDLTGERRVLRVTLERSITNAQGEMLTSSETAFTDSIVPIGSSDT